MRLILMRHAEAESLVSNDSARRLTSRGLQQAASIGLVLAEQPIDYCVSSPFIRAIQSLDQVCAAQPMLAKGRLPVCADFVPNASAAIALRAIELIQQKHQPHCLLVVMHMNLIADLHAYLLGASPVLFDLAQMRMYTLPVCLAGHATQVGS